LGELYSALKPSTLDLGRKLPEKKRDKGKDEVRKRTNEKGEKKRNWRGNLSQWLKGESTPLATVQMIYLLSYLFLAPIAI